MTKSIQVSELFVSLIVAAAAIGSANGQSVSISFTNLPFTGYSGVDDCEEGTEFLSGKALGMSISDDNPNAVCEETEYTVDGETFTTYTGIVLQCTSQAIGKKFYACNDADCRDCDDEPFQYGVQNWDDVAADADTCYSNAATMDAGADAEAGVETVVVTSSWTFDNDADPDEVDEFNDFVFDNTCIGDGPPEIGEEEEGVQCLSYGDLICMDLEESSPYTLEVACQLFKALGELDPFNSTIFVPTDFAFTQFEDLILTTDLDDVDEDVLLDIILFHGTNATALYEDLQCTETIEMWNGMDSRTKCMKTEDGMNVGKYQKGGGNKKNDLLPQIIVADLLACDGNVVHIVSQVMLPNYIDENGLRKLKEIMEEDRSY